MFIPLYGYWDGSLYHMVGTVLRSEVDLSTGEPRITTDDQIDLGLAIERAHKVSDLSWPVLTT